MNILIITHFYEIDGVMGSVRWTSFAHRLAKKHNVYIVTHAQNSQKIGTIEKKDNISVIYVDNECEYVKRGKKRKKDNIYSTFSKSPSNYKKTFKNIIKDIIKSTAKSWLYMLSMYMTAKKNAKYAEDELSKIGVSLDYVISTSRPFINCFTAFNIAKKKRTPWLFDQRDLPYSDGASRIEIASFRYALRHFDRFVSKYTLVSKGMADSFIDFCKFKKKQKDKTFVLNNGYDTTHKSTLEKEINDGVLTIAYAGDLYEGKRDANILFDALNQVMKDDRFVPNDVRIDYAGNSSVSLYETAKKYGLEEVIKDRGRVPHKEAIKMQQNSDLLLLLTWNTLMDRGVLSGKLYEYMMVEKPIVCITSGEIPNGEAEIMIKEMNLGVAVNYIEYEQGVKQLSKYITEQLLNKKNGSLLTFAPNEQMVKEFDYDYLVDKLEAIMF